MRRLKLALVWHMHQPCYLWPNSTEAALPFARLHAYGAYLDMPWLVRRFDETTVTFNLVPSLMAQISGYATGAATDRALELARKPAAELEPDEQSFLLTSFSAAHPDNMRDRSPRYAQLSHKRGLSRNPDSIETSRRGFTTQEFLDLQVWYNLACCGCALQHQSEVVRQLWVKDRDFSEHDKAALFAELQLALQQTSAEYARARDEGRAELSTSPYYHPILPLLADMRDAGRRIPRGDLPETLWQAPDEARRHLARARGYHRELFGEDPAGLWPSEGSVSDAALALIEEAGFGWTASDEEVLLRSLRPGGGRAAPAELYRPYRVASGNLALVFRDHHLSDRIGFVYRDWAPHDAAADFVGNLIGIASGLSEAKQPPLVCVILDGENPWGAYPDGGEGFLRALYGALESEGMVATTSVTEYLAEFPPTERLESVFPGSWIDHSFRTWIGGPEHKQAWSLLRDAYEAFEAPPPGDEPEAAHEYLMRAEGSDWFWWYSEFHHDEYDEVFDALFRANVASVYEALGKPEPPELGESLAVEGLGRLARAPAGILEVTIDGRVTSYFEWQAAGCMRTASLVSAMHRSDAIVREIHCGFDSASLYLRVDTAGRAAALLQHCRLCVTFDGGRDLLVSLGTPTEPDGGTLRLAGELAPAAFAAADTVVELGVPVSALGLTDNSAINLAVSVEEDGRTLERWPPRGYLRLQVPTEDALSGAWLV